MIRIIRDARGQYFHRKLKSRQTWKVINIVLNSTKNANQETVSINGLAMMEY